jgi:hypothetical protein
LSKSIDEFGIGYLLPFKQMIHDYLDKNNELILNEAINFYVNEMIDFFEVFIDKNEIEFYNEVKRELINLWNNNEK